LHLGRMVKWDLVSNGLRRAINYEDDNCETDGSLIAPGVETQAVNAIKGGTPRACGKVLGGRNRMSTAYVSLT
jgi:hypothetical protein